MSWIIEIYYAAPAQPHRDDSLCREVAKFGGVLDFRESPLESGPSTAVVLTFDFDDPADAEKTAVRLRGLGQHVEGPYPYG